MRIRSALFALALLSPALPAQTAVPESVPHATIETVGPDGWRIRFGPTNVGSLLESEQGRGLWEPHVLPWIAKWQQLVGDDAAFATMRSRLLGYGGRIRAGVRFQPNAVGDFDQAQHGALVFDGDGRTDLPALAKDLRDLAYRALRGEWTTLEIDGQPIEVRKDGDEVVTAPRLEGSHLTIAFARDGDLAAARALGRTLATGCDGKAPAPGGPALRLRYDLGALVKLSLGARGGTQSALMKALGVESLGDTTITVGTAGPHVQVEMMQQFTSDERGMFGILLPASAGVSPLLQVAAGSPIWKVGRLDLGRLPRVIEDAVVASGGQTAEQWREEAKRELGIDLEQDLLAHVTDEALLLGSPLRGLDSLREATWTLVVALRDQAAFEKGLMAMLPKARPMLSREEETKHGDVAVYRYGGMFGYDLWLAVGRGVFVFAGGRDAEEQVGQVLDRCKELPKEPPALPEFAPLQRFLPPGHNGLAAGDLGSVFLLPGELWFGLLGEIAPLPDAPTGNEADADRRAEVRELLKQHHLDVLRTATGFLERTWRWRVFW